MRRARIRGRRAVFLPDQNWSRSRWRRDCGDNRTGRPLYISITTTTIRVQPWLQPPIPPVSRRPLVAEPHAQDGSDGSDYHGPDDAPRDGPVSL